MKPHVSSRGAGAELKLHWRAPCQAPMSETSLLSAAKRVLLSRRRLLMLASWLEELSTISGISSRPRAHEVSLGLAKSSFLIIDGSNAA